MKHLQAGVDLRTVWLGHKDLESTMRYLKPAQGNPIREMVNATFASTALSCVYAEKAPNGCHSGPANDFKFRPKRRPSSIFWLPEGVCRARQTRREFLAAQVARDVCNLVVVGWSGSADGAAMAGALGEGEQDFRVEPTRQSGAEKIIRQRTREAGSLASQFRPCRGVLECGGGIQ